jgi:hypothetical protein
MYLIPFSDFEKALVGVVDGSMRFDGSKMKLSVGTPGTWSNGVYDVYIYSLYFRTIHQNGMNIAVEDVA